MVKSKIFWIILGLAVVILGAIIYWAYNSAKENSPASELTDGSRPTISLIPTAGTYNVGETFEVEIAYDTAGQNISVIDARLNYDPSQLEIQGDQPVALSSSFTLTTDNNATDGQINITSGSLNPVTGSGTLGTIQFKALAPVEASQVTFEPAETFMAFEGVKISVNIADASFILE